jgi:hypothetical protein
MSSASGPNIPTSGLTLGVDTTNTAKSWRGQPTINQFVIPTPDVNGFVTFPVQGTAGFQRIYSGTYGGYEIQPSDIVYKYVLGLGPTACHYHGNTISVTAGQTPTWSFDYYIDPSTTGYPVTNYLANMESSIGVGAALTDPTPGTIGVWKRATQTSAAASSNGTFNAYLYPGACGTQMATGGFILYKNPQVELNSFATPFVAGTRSNTQAIVDITSNNTLTTTSLTYASNGTVTFNGINNYATISTFINKPTTALTCEAWIRPTKASVGTGLHRGGVISCTNTTYLGLIDSSDGGITFSLHWANQTSVSRNGGQNGSIPNNQWSHIVGTYDGTRCKGYINGVVVYDVAQTGTIPDGTWVIGTYGAGLSDGVHNFNGSISVARIYNRSLSDAEVLQNYVALRTNYGLN